MSNNIVNILAAPTVRASLILKHGKASEWAEINPILLEGELGIETDTHFIKAGDGKNRYKKLPYLNATSVQLLFDGAYDSETNKVALQSTITEAIQSLDGILTNEASSNKTLTSFNQTNGVVTATFDDIEITLSQISDAGTAAERNAVSVINDYNEDSHDIPDITAVVNYVTNRIPTLDSVMKFRGVVEELPSDDDSDYFSGDIICVEGSSKEYIYNGEKWQEFGDEGAYALRTISVTGEDGLIGGGTLESNISLKHVISEGAGTNNNVVASNNKFVNGIEFDKFGHVTKINTEEVATTDTQYTFSEGTVNGSFDVTATDGTAQSIKIHGLNNAAYKDVATNGIVQNDERLVNATQVYNYVEAALTDLILNCGTSTTVI